MTMRNWMIGCSYLAVAAIHFMLLREVNRRTRFKTDFGTASSMAVLWPLLMIVIASCVFSGMIDYCTQGLTRRWQASKTYLILQAWWEDPGKPRSEG